MTRDYQDEYDRDQVTRYGGVSGDYEAIEGQPFPRGTTEALANEAVAAQQAEYDPAVYPDEIPYEEPAYPYFDDMYPAEPGDDYNEQPQPPDPFESDDYASEMEQYLDARDQRLAAEHGLLEQPDPYEQFSPIEAAQANEREAAMAQQDAQQMVADQIEARFGGGRVAREAAGMLAPAAHDLAEQTAQELVAKLKAQGYTHEQAIQALAPHKEALIHEATSTVREAYGTAQLFEEMRARARR
jgi:hypothetical protein